MRYLILLLLPLSACSSVRVDPEPDLERARELAAASTGLDTSGLDPWAEPALPEELIALASDGLTLEEAQLFALRHDPTLQATMLEVGVAHADWVQAQRLANPALDLLVRLPSGGGRALLELVVGMNLLELWQVPLREEREQHRVRAAVLVAARRAGELSRDVRDGYHGLLLAREALELADQEFELAGALRSSVAELVASGAADILDDNLAELQLVQAGVSRRAAAAEQAHRERVLIAMLAVEAGSAELTLADSLPAPLAEAPDAQQLVLRALASRPDLVALGETVQALAAQVRVTDAESAGELTVGPAGERGTDGATEVGAALTWTPPLFDSGDARQAAAELRRDQAVRLLRAARLQVSLDVRDAAARLGLATSELEVHVAQTLPLHQLSLDLSQIVYAAGERDLRSLILVRGELLAAQREQLRLRGEVAAALVELERAVGGSW